MVKHILGTFSLFECDELIGRLKSELAAANARVKELEFLDTEAVALAEEAIPPDIIDHMTILMREKMRAHRAEERVALLERLGNGMADARSYDDIGFDNYDSVPCENEEMTEAKAAWRAAVPQKVEP